ncbi:MAG: hypothetical protein IKR77_06900, partial [Bacteroidales bacterium]|nr:hypothetical protein [Bacteroidales bacterium]
MLSRIFSSTSSSKFPISHKFFGGFIPKSHNLFLKFFPNPQFSSLTAQKRPAHLLSVQTFTVMISTTTAHISAKIHLTYVRKPDFLEPPSAEADS